MVGFCSDRSPFIFGGTDAAKGFRRWPLRGERIESPLSPTGGFPSPLPSPPPRGEGETEGGRWGGKSRQSCHFTDMTSFSDPLTSPSDNN